MTDALLKRLTASATGAFDLHRSHYRKDCADALAEIERLLSGVYQSVLNLKMLYMDAGLGTKKGLEALAVLSAEIKALDQLVIVHQQTTQTTEK